MGPKVHRKSGIILLASLEDDMLSRYEHAPDNKQLFGLEYPLNV